MSGVSVVIPAYNEEGAIAETITNVRSSFEGYPLQYEIIVVDDASSDATAEKAAAAGSVVIKHPKNIGYGNSILSGVRKAKYPIIAMTDADSTYPVSELPGMADELLKRKLHMLVGARQGMHYAGSWCKSIARKLFKLLAEFAVGHGIPDINSGMRVLHRDLIRRFEPVLCGGFSFTTTLTIVLFLTNHFVDYRPIEYFARTGQSKVRHFRDTVRTAQILVMAILLFNPIKMYLLCALSVVAGGAVAVASFILFPFLRLPITVASLFLLVAALLMGLGFLAEQQSRIAALSWKSVRNDV